MEINLDFELVHESSKNAVLLFHGLTGSPVEMKKYGAYLHKLGYDIYCYSFPGHGNKLNEIMSVTWRDWCNFAQGKYNEIRPKYDNFFVSGLCLGAAVSLYLAENNQDISGVISLSTTLYLDGFCLPKIKFLMPLGLNTIVRYFYTFPEDESMGIKNEITRKSLAKIMTKTTVGMDNYPLSCVYELLKLSKVVIANLEKVTAPLLLVHSITDNLTSVKSAKVVYDKVSSKVKKYVELKDSYHMVLYDNEKMFVYDTVENFIGEILTSLEQEQSLV